MNELVYLKNDEAVCSSLLVAEKFEKRHADVMRAIDNLVENDSTQNCVQCFKRGTYKDSTGKSNKMYVMNRDGFTFLVMGFTGKKANEWKWQYIKAFNQMEKFIREKQTKIWIETRKAGKLTRKAETDTIKNLVEYAKAQGSQHADKLYMTYSKLANKMAGVSKRDEATVMQLNNLSLMEHQILDDNRFLVMGNDYQERKAFTGTVAYIPYLDNAEITEDGTVISGKISINYVDAPNIFPVSWNNGKVTECIFVFPHTIARKKYVQLQSHLLENGKYVIKNTVLRCDSGSQEGTELPEKEWKQLKPFKELAKEVRTGSSEAQFVIDRLNITNNADENNPMGVAIFANAIDTLKKLDIEYDSYCNEFELGRKRIFVRPEMLTNADGTPAFDPDDSVFYALPEDDANGEGLLKEIDMSLRAEQHSKAINDDLNYLSLKCGFGTDRYQFGATGAKTATEIISENSDMYRMIKKHEILLEDALRQLIQIIIRLGMILGNTLNPECEITIDFDDSIIEDKETERSRDRQDVSMGVMSLAEYRAKWYGESEEDAAKNLPEQNQVME